MPSSQDHKRAFDGNQGPNTGGMGAISPSPNYTPEVAERCMEEIFLPTVAALRAEGRPFHGVLYFGLMLTPDGPKVVEYNARFGDPECQAVLSLLDSDLMDIFLACRNGTLDQVDVRWKDGAACCLVLASGGYPGSYGKGYPITGLEEAGQSAVVFHAGTRLGEDGSVLTSGGRVLGVTATGPGAERGHRRGLCRRLPHPLPGHVLPLRHRPGVANPERLEPQRHATAGCQIGCSGWLRGDGPFC